jgi:hypothetical protein
VIVVALGGSVEVIVSVTVVDRIEVVVTGWVTVVVAVCVIVVGMVAVTVSVEVAVVVMIDDDELLEDDTIVIGQLLEQA